MRRMLMLAPLLALGCSMTTPPALDHATPTAGASQAFGAPLGAAVPMIGPAAGEAGLTFVRQAAQDSTEWVAWFAEAHPGSLLRATYRIRAVPLGHDSTMVWIWHADAYAPRLFSALRVRLAAQR